MAALAAVLRLARGLDAGMTTPAPDRAPRVSVLVAAYNAERFLARTLHSALAQTFTDFEILVVDDGSSDGTAALVRDLMARDARLRLIVQANQGLSASHNRAVAESRGELIAFLDHDDLWHPEKLAAQVARFDADPEVGVVSCYSEILDDEGRSAGWRLGGDAVGNVYAEMLEWDMVSGGSVVLIRRGALESAGPFDTNLRVRDDWDMWIRLARRVRFATVPRTLVGYTRRPSNESRDAVRMADEGRRVLAKAAAEDPSLSRGLLREHEARDLVAVASFCTIDGQTAHAWRYLVASIRCSPWPVARSPKRWGLVAALLLQTVLPRRAYVAVVGLASSWLWASRAGRLFLDEGTA